MQSTILAYLFLILSLVFFVTTIYFLFQLKLKKKDGRKLTDELSDLQIDIDKNKKKLSENIDKLEKLNKELAHLKDLEKSEKSLKDNVENSTLKLNELIKEIEELNTSKMEITDTLLNIKDDVSIFQPILDLINVGFVNEPEYLFETSERFKEEIKILRELQKKLIFEKDAISVPDSIALTSNNAYTKKILISQSQLMLKAFNVECDLLMSKVKTSNYPKVLERIDKLATTIEKLSISLKCGFNKDYPYVSA